MEKQYFVDDLQGFCIICKEKIPLNPDNPYCVKCGNECNFVNRYSTSEDMAYICHKCGKISYVSSQNPICTNCLIKLKRKK